MSLRANVQVARGSFLLDVDVAVAANETVAVLGPNGSGKSTLLATIAGLLPPDRGRIEIGERVVVDTAAGVDEPVERRAVGLVFQDHLLFPNLTARDNVAFGLRARGVPKPEARRRADEWLDRLGVAHRAAARPRALSGGEAQRVALARALAIEPDVLMMDEMTAALPANLTERVLEVVGRLRGGERSVLFISHRMIEIAAVCDRATVLREGVTVGVVDVTAGSEERIVELMLGEATSEIPAAEARAAREARETKPRLTARNLAAKHKLEDVSFDVHPGEVLGVVALEGQGQDELFDILAGSTRPTRGELLIDGAPASFRHPADAIRAGLVYVPADRAEALLMQRSVRENIALPFSTAMRRWALIDMGQERTKVDGAIDTLQIDTRAQGEVRRLSGGNQQKVTIARWVADGVHTMLCFDPTRGIDIRTKHQIYRLLRDLAEAGAAVLLYTSELKEIQLACDRAIVIFGGRVVAEIAVEDADEPTLLRAAYNLRADALMPEEIAAEAVAAVDGDEATTRSAVPAVPTGGER
jgi:ribose transport system ATP-binding protein